MSWIRGALVSARPPLRMVSIYSQLLQEEYEDALGAQASSYIKYAVNGATRMSNLLRALLTYSRVANAVPQAPEPTTTILTRAS